MTFFRYLPLHAVLLALMATSPGSASQVEAQEKAGKQKVSSELPTEVEVAVPVAREPVAVHAPPREVKARSVPPLQERDPLSLTELVVACWRPEFAEFTPKASSWEAKYLEIAEIVLAGDFAEGLARLGKLESESRTAGPKSHRRLAHLLWEAQVAHRQLCFPYESGRWVPGRPRISPIDTLMRVMPEYTSLQNAQPVNTLPWEDALVAEHYGNRFLIKLHGEMPAALYQHEVVKKLRPHQPAPQYPPQAQWDDLTAMFAYDQKRARTTRILPMATLDLLQYDLDGRVAAAKGKRADAVKKYEQGASAARKAKLARAEAHFHLRLGDLEFVGMERCPETLMLAMEVEDQLRASIMNAGGAPEAAVDATRYAVAERHYDEVRALLPALPPGAADALRARLAIRAAMALVNADRARCIQEYEAAVTELAKVPHAVTLLGLTQGMHAMLTGDWNEYAHAAKLLHDRGDQGGLATLGMAAGGFALRTNATHQPFVALPLARMARAALGEMDDAMVLVSDLLCIEAHIALGVMQRDRTQALLQEALWMLQEHRNRLEKLPGSLGRQAALGDIMGAESLTGTAMLHTLNQQMLSELESEGSIADWKARRNDLRTKLEVLVRAAPEAMQARHADAEGLIQMVDSVVELSQAYNSPKLGEVYQKLIQKCPMGSPLWIELTSFASQHLPEVREKAVRELEKRQPIQAIKAAIAAVDQRRTEQNSQQLGRAMANFTDMLRFAMRLEAWPLVETWIQEIREVPATEKQAEWQTLRFEARAAESDLALGQGNASRALNLLQKLLAENEERLLKAAQESTEFPGTRAAFEMQQVRLREMPRSVRLPAAIPTPQLNMLNRMLQAHGVEGKELEKEAAAAEEGTVILRTEVYAEEALLTWLKMEQMQKLLLATQSSFQLADQASLELADLAREISTRPELVTEEMRKQKRALEATLRDEHAPALPRAVPTNADLRAWQQALPLHTSVLIYHPMERFTLAWRVRANAPVEMKVLPVPMNDLGRRAGLLRKYLLEDYAGWEKHAAQLHDWLVKPLGDFPAGETVVVVTNPLTAQFPFEVLMDPSGKRPWLLDIPVLYASESGMAAAMGTATTAAAKASPGGRAPVPDAGMQPAPGPVAPHPAVVIGFGGVSQLMEDEAREVAKLMNTSALLRVDATREKASVAMPSASWVHVTAHGTLDGQNPFRSHLMLQDGPVYVRQLLGMAKQADVVVLSACDTQRSGSRSVAGFTGSSGTMAAFMLGGQARWIVASLWKCPDGPAHDVIMGFYTRIMQQGVPRAEALRASKAALQQAGTRPMAYAPLVLLVKSPQVLKSDPHFRGEKPANRESTGSPGQ